ncbi:unnamed protein product [Kluyveromyces dobzhanskii CBS 2104]|uniref:WGS project CCBQ000000000 data, contig 00015 n=1 Tax=Kluyveromyces dobzhanskii CBS 2104 TaxID=1427455 RepID=A0A0A8L9F6_9SACH|nr:unnamed protein product [Kluyveromyces dobzhanskii CBS 2104]
MKRTKSTKKRANIRRLTGVLKDLLAEEKPKKEKNSDETTSNGAVYILSKENQLIPKLSDEDVMERHKKADENMKEVWSQIIQKYENIEDQGDVVDLQTGEIIEDNGHLRSLGSEASTLNTSVPNSGSVIYKSVLNDIFDIKLSQNSSVWQDQATNNSEDESDFEENNSAEELESDQGEDSRDYINNFISATDKGK